MMSHFLGSGTYTILGSSLKEVLFWQSACQQKCVLMWSKFRMTNYNRLSPAETKSLGKHIVHLGHCHVEATHICCYGVDTLKMALALRRPVSEDPFRQ